MSFAKLMWQSVASYVDVSVRGMSVVYPLVMNVRVPVQSLCLKASSLNHKFLMDTVSL